MANLDLREWLLTDGRGGFASGTVSGIPTRRYHGLLIASARPPLERWLLLASVLERITIGGVTHELATFEFSGAIHPRGYEYLTRFQVRNAAPLPTASFTYEHESFKLIKRVTLPRGGSGVRIEYDLQVRGGDEAELAIMPMVAMRDFHATTHSFPGGFPCATRSDRIIVESTPGGTRLEMVARVAEGQELQVDPTTDWWYGIHHREEASRGQDDREDWFVPGWFRSRSSSTTHRLTIEATAVFPWVNQVSRPPVVSTASAPALEAEMDVETRLREAADAFVVARRKPDGSDSVTVIAGYPWFGDWGRDTFIAMPGLFFETGRFDEARQVLETFASAQQDGIIPNRFSDYGDGCDYNSIDASLWYLHAATQYYKLTDDLVTWRQTLEPVCRRMIEAFERGTIFDIHLDDDGLISAGNEHTQLTWMDAKYGDTVFTPRHGKAVEVNALWYSGLIDLAEIVSSSNERDATRFRAMADRAGASLASSFWNPRDRCLYDVVRDDYRDPAIRPNQIIAVSLPHSALSIEQQRSVVEVVSKHLLTPYGLRSLSPADPAYRPHYGGNGYERDSAYHQGTVWGWLIGPYVEAYLRVHGFSKEAKAAMREHLQALIRHLDEHGIGSVSEIFDGDPPHTPNGCIAQAWSVAELLRAWNMTK